MLRAILIVVDCCVSIKNVHKYFLLIGDIRRAN